jgi:class 3 adenylate cyclase
MRLWVAPALMVLNVVVRIASNADPALDHGAFDRMLMFNLPSHAANVLINLWVLRRSRTEATYRSAATVSLALETFTAVHGLWLQGSVTNWNFLFVICVIGAYRVYYDASMGLRALAAAFVLHGGLVALEAGGALPSHALYPSLKLPEYRSPTHLVINGIALGAAYVLAWLFAGWAARRIRTSEHDLRQLNVTLEERVRDQVDKLERAARLRRYLAPQLVDKILASDVDPVASRERRPITVMFADLRGFTNMVEHVAPEQLAQILTRYFDEVAHIAFAHGGTIDKFIGDAIMVFFGAPEIRPEAEQAQRCVAMAIAIQKRVAILGEDFVALGAEKPLEVRIGIASGVATVGAFGATHRADYTIVGLPVNRAARLEPLAPPGGILIDEATRDFVGTHAQVEAGGAVTLKGFTHPVATFRVVA